MGKPLILVTGGAGYIGSHTIVELIDKGFDVVSIDNFSRSAEYVLECIKAITGKTIVNHRVDLTNDEAIKNVVSSCSEIAGIIHFAAYKSVPESVREPHLYYHNNIVSLLNVISCIREFKIPSLVFSSSCSVYGDIEQLPVTEETQLSVPKSPYAYTKVVGERIVSDSAKAYQFNAINLRYFNPVGAHKTALLGELPLQRPDNLLPVIMQTAVGRLEKLTVYGGDLPTRDGSCIRDYVHVSDIARAHVQALNFLDGRKQVCDVINLGTGNGVSVLEAVNEFEAISGKKLNYEIGAPREGDVIEIYSDASKALSLLGWKAEYVLRDMVETAWNWQNFLEKSYYSKMKPV